MMQTGLKSVNDQMRKLVSSQFFYFDFVEFVKSSFACCIIILCSEQINMFNIH